MMNSNELLVYAVMAILLLGIMVLAGMLYSAKSKMSELQTLIEKVNTVHGQDEEAVTTLQRKLSEAEQFRFQMLNIAAHELKNPLVAVINFSELLNEPDMTPMERHVILSQASGMAERALTLINSLLEAHRLDVGQVRAEIGNISLLPILHDIVQTYRPIAKHKSIIIFNEYPLPTQAEIHIKADETMVRQILDNLISNAVKFTEFNKTVIVNVQEADLDSFEETSLPNNRPTLTNTAKKVSPRRVRISIKDEGPGVLLEDMKKMFGMFTKLSARPTGGENSTGVGLSIVKRMAETMNGRVWCESQYGAGATFYLELPSEIG